MKYYLAIDLGATSGRHILAHEENGQLVLEEVYRFLTNMHPSKDGLVWNIPQLFTDIKEGIRRAFAITQDIVSLSIDSWGVDYVLMAGDKEIPPYYAYRNERLDESYKKVHQIIPFKELYAHTGIQFANFNTIYQLYDDKEKGRLEKATDYLMIPSYFTYKLTGIKTHEYTDESTGAYLNPFTKDYDLELTDRLGLPRKLFKGILPPGTVVGELTPEIQKEVGGNCKVVLCASHDTGSAFEAVSCPDDAIILSSGTWSLIGVKSDKPNTSEVSYETNFTNEGGVGYIRYLKNIMGMWIANEITRQKNLDIKEICLKLNDITYSEIFDVNDPSLNAPENMEAAVRNLLKHNPPKDDLELFASVFRSLATSYTLASQELEKNLNKEYHYIYIVGGGAKNLYLNDLTEKLSHKKVVAIPVEATSIGNIKMQIKAME